MPSDRMIIQALQVSAHNIQGLGQNALETRFYAEDGWVFREHPGKRIECIGRYDDAQVMDLWRPHRLNQT